MPPFRFSLGLLGAGLALAPGLAFGQVAGAGHPEVTAVLEQNRILQQQVQQQQRQIDDLRARLDAIESPGPTAARHPAPPMQAARAVRLCAELGVAFFASGDDGDYPNSEFRIDDAKVFLEAPVWKNVFFFAGLELTTREANDEFFHVGELYVDAEQVLSGGRDYSLNLRAGRFSIPFGEEYQERGVMTNPLISHSVADIWGIDEGVQAYGSLGRLRYNLAVQNGGHQTLRDFDADKAFTLRLGFKPAPRLHLSVSAMRTGDLTVAGDGMSEIWIGNAFFRALGSATTTRTFAADLTEIDASWTWEGGHLKGAAGRINFDDDSTAGDNSRKLSYYSIEARQKLGPNLFGAARYSAIDAPRGYPLAGHGNAGKYFYNPFAPLTTELARLSVGLGYQFGPPLVWKIEYSWETGRLVSGVRRNDEDMLSSILGVRF
jgi:hypothetical protein